RVKITGYDPRAFPFCQQREDDSDRSLADHKDRFAFLELQRLNPLQASIDRLDVAGLLIGNVVGNFDYALLHDPIHHANVLGEAAAAGLVAGGHAHLLVGRALGKNLALAVVAFAAGNVMEDHHTFTEFETLHTFADGSDLTRDLVSEDARRG